MSINKVLYNIDQRSKTTDAEKKTARDNIGAIGEIWKNYLFVRHQITAEEESSGIIELEIDSSTVFYGAGRFENIRESRLCLESIDVSFQFAITNSLAPLRIHHDELSTDNATSIVYDCGCAIVKTGNLAESTITKPILPSGALSKITISFIFPSGLLIADQEIIIDYTAITIK